jgi:iron complex outermembrane receptor protein
VDDYQIQVIENGLARTVNTDGIEGAGFESELQAVFNRHWQLQLAYTYTHAQFKDFATDQGNLDGKQTILTPEHSSFVALNYQTSDYHWGSLSLLWRTQYQSDIYFTAQNNSQAKQSSFFQSFAQLTYSDPGERWQIDFFARNVFDKDYVIFKQDVGAGPVARRGTPRYLGVAFSGTF